MAFVRASVEPDESAPLTVVQVGTNGRPLLVPGPQCPLLPPEPLPKRGSAREAFSPYVVHTAPGRPPRRVPAHAVLRDFRRLAPRPHGEHADGWALPDPVQIVVLSIRHSRHRVSYGWFVRWEGADDHVLRKVSPRLCWLLQSHMAGDSSLSHSVLVTKYPDSDLWLRRSNLIAPHTRERTFLELAESAWAPPPAQAHAQERSKRSREAPLPSPPPEPAAAAAAVGPCVVCLEEHASAAVRCRSGTCRVLVCDGCHRKTRGLCPLCDRGNISADFLCAGCGRIERLAEFGLPCARCQNTALCSTCYGQCRSCDACGAA